MFSLRHLNLGLELQLQVKVKYINIQQDRFHVYSLKVCLWTRQFIDVLQEVSSEWHDLVPAESFIPKTKGICTAAGQAQKVSADLPYAHSCPPISPASGQENKLVWHWHPVWSSCRTEFFSSSAVGKAVAFHWKHTFYFDVLFYYSSTCPCLIFACSLSSINEHGLSEKFPFHFHICSSDFVNYSRCTKTFFF